MSIAPMRFSRRKPVFNSTDPQNQEVDARTEEFRKIKKDIADIAHVRAVTEQSFAQLTSSYIRLKGYNKAVFCEKTLLSEKVYDRIVNNDYKAMPKIETVIAICIGLNLGIIHGTKLLGAAGYILNNSGIHCAYQHLLNSHSDKGIYECNEILVMLGFRAL